MDPDDETFDDGMDGEVEVDDEPKMVRITFGQDVVSSPRPNFKGGSGGSSRNGGGDGDYYTHKDDDVRVDDVEDQGCGFVGDGSQKKTSVFVFFGAFFVTIATVLGTGILGLPVKLSRSGFAPFVFSYSICFVFQAAILFFMVEILQRAQQRMAAREGTTVSLSDNDRLQMLRGEEDVDLNLTDHDSLGVMSPADDMKAMYSANEGGVDQSDGNDGTDGEEGASAPLSHGPDLHTIGLMYLGPVARKAFDFSVMLHFISIMISYALAGSQAYGDMLGLSPSILIAPFVAILALLVTFFDVILQTVISVMTFVKGSLLVVMVAITAVVGYQVNNAISDDWLYSGQPFLIGTVALGGAVNLLPVVYCKIKFTREDMVKFLWAVTLGLLVVFLLNIAWAFYVLRIVPQRGEGNTLQEAQEKGQISTIPLVQIIRDEHKKYLWAAIIVNIFIMVSITVSFITMGTGLKHVIDGYIKSWTSKMSRVAADPSSATAKDCSTKAWLFFSPYCSVRVLQAVLYAGSYALVLGVSMMNPKGFLEVMELATSLALNLESGFFVAWMMGVARRMAERNQEGDIPLPTWGWLYAVRWVVMFYFLFAVMYDVVIIGVALVERFL